MARLTFEKLRKAFKEVNTKGEMFQTDRGVSVSFDYDSRFTAVATGFEDLNKYYNYNGTLLEVAEKLKLDAVVAEHKDNKVYKDHGQQEVTTVTLTEAEQAEFNELFGF